MPPYYIGNLAISRIKDDGNVETIRYPCKYGYPFGQPSDYTTTELGQQLLEQFFEYNMHVMKDLKIRDGIDLIAMAQKKEALVEHARKRNKLGPLRVYLTSWNLLAPWLTRYPDNYPLPPVNCQWFKEDLGKLILLKLMIVNPIANPDMAHTICIRTNTQYDEMCLRYKYWMDFDLETLPDETVYLVKFGHLETEIVANVLCRNASHEDEEIAKLAGEALEAIESHFEDVDVPAEVETNKPPVIIELFPTASEDDSDSTPDLAPFAYTGGTSRGSPSPSFQHCSQLSQPSILPVQKKSPNPSPTKRHREDTPSTTCLSRAFPESDSAFASGGYEQNHSASDASDACNEADAPVRDIQKIMEEGFAEMRRREEEGSEFDDSATHLNSYLYSGGKD
ncbi:hypothetical protein SEMRO_1408_G270110.1 [Seminavis robusta]|uniref:Uncharacterized protein n=1 Tax=Seminavis robusta TaxID=568900 RepID=A0A9N8EQP0_9STRA|nr:hypothetical protein SEMRO_1408_G270110.1 [Seminavis robusta]|eukprot:Sro1408_g270110.1 n/a (394) ;mRNA; f:24434-25615